MKPNDLVICQNLKWESNGEKIRPWTIVVTMVKIWLEDIMMVLLLHTYTYTWVVFKGGGILGVFRFILMMTEISKRWAKVLNKLLETLLFVEKNSSTCVREFLRSNFHVVALLGWALWKKMQNYPENLTLKLEIHVRL